MGGCVGASRDGAMHSGESSDISGTLGHSKPLKPRKPKWKSDVRLTEAQLQSKRDEFWDTAPAFEGRKEIWDALKASSCALESGDHQLAQAILDGANVTLPNGTLLECYDELGNRYQLPVYVLSAPINMLKEGSEFDSAHALTDDLASPPAPGIEVPIRLHLSTGKDFKLTVRSSDTILNVKRQIHALEGVEPSRQRLFFSGRQLADKLRVDDAKIHKGYTLQVIVSEPPPPPSLPHPVVATALISVPPPGPVVSALSTLASVPPSVGGSAPPAIIPAATAVSNDIVTVLPEP